MPEINLSVNGARVTAEIEPRTLLSQFLRDEARTTGVHIGCDTSQCGACVVDIDGAAVKSCTVLALQANGKNITTVEGLADGDTLHPVQEAFRKEHGLQCGFCTPGMIMTAVDLLKRNPDPDEKTIREELEGNICRCTGYHNIVRAVQAAAREMGRGQ